MQFVHSARIQGEHNVIQYHSHTPLSLYVHFSKLLGHDTITLGFDFDSHFIRFDQRDDITILNCLTNGSGPFHNRSL